MTDGGDSGEKSAPPAVPVEELDEGEGVERPDWLAERRRYHRRTPVVRGLYVAGTGALAIVGWWGATAAHGFPSWPSVRRALPLSLVLSILGALAALHAGRLKELRREHGWEVWREIATGFIAGAVLSFAFNSISDDIENERQVQAEQLENLRYMRTTLAATREHHEDRRFAYINLAQANLDGLDLAGADLSSADLRGVSLSGADLTGANLTGANLAGAWGFGANLSGARLVFTNLQNANFSGAIMNGSDLSDSHMDPVYMVGTWLKSARLEGADMSGADMAGAQLPGANMAETNLSGAELRGSNLAGVQINGAWWDPSKPPKWPDGIVPPPNSKSPYDR